MGNSQIKENYTEEWTPEGAEKTNGRLAMLGFFGVIIREHMMGHSVLTKYGAACPWDAAACAAERAAELLSRQ
eukprot:g35461.t1